ncbi:Dabb family protein [Cecembia rubra]|uniref:Stress responsive alpha/beta barrel protein n=1 Tax=Cecembia rubra TaxID=1485585 RepID=A0A2P8EEG1_9BACT|nr:Dabb family protein [Cecembia rubra]PSL07852.1 stress responsive alpha/beta barrel protein [Cecembia rubra]
MKKQISTLLFLLILGVACQAPQKEKVEEKIIEKKIIKMDKALRHVVLFKFKDESSEEEVQKVVDAFMALKSKISEIEDLEWGTNNSPEGLDQGFTHCFFVTFKSEEDRDIYLPHPEHKAFVQILGPHLDKVLVVDYWAKRD